jgi:hypothetical protein
MATGYSKPQVGFLMRNTDRMTSALQVSGLNDKAKACGIDSARAYVLVCLDKQLFPLQPAQAPRWTTRAKQGDFGA